MELLIAMAIEAVAGAIGGNAISSLLGHNSVNWIVRTLAGMAGGVGGGATVASQVGDPIAGNGVIHLFVLAIAGLVGGGVLSGIAGALLKGSR